ncbi:MAG: hypothetical protein H6740_22935 [Alphaproteobacteria bacterium]|nr:hypothetical protein [Alphaproteobacteria bacterium]
MNWPTLLLAFLAGLALAGAAMLVVVRRLAAEIKGEHAVEKQSLEAELQLVANERTEALRDAESVRRALDLLRDENLEMEDRLEIRDEWVSLRDEQLARAERTLSKARKAYGELQRKREDEEQLRAELERQVAARDRELEIRNERSAAMRAALQVLMSTACGEETPIPRDPVEALQVAVQRVQAHYSSLGTISQESETLKSEVARLRRSLSATTQAFQEYKERAEGELDGYASVLAGRGQPLPGDLSPEIARAVVRRQASEIQLKAARTELDDLRTKLRFANKTIRALEIQLQEIHREPVVPDMLSGLRSPSIPPGGSH